MYSIIYLKQIFINNFIEFHEYFVAKTPQFPIRERRFSVYAGALDLPAWLLSYNLMQKYGKLNNVHSSEETEIREIRETRVYADCIH